MVKEILKVLALVTSVISAFLVYVFFMSEDPAWKRHITEQFEEVVETVGLKSALISGQDRAETESDEAAMGHKIKKLHVEPVLIKTQAGTITIQAEIADKKEDQITGLMYRKTMGADEGMLFVYEVVQDITMWMRNTLLPLDMVFISKDGYISHIAYSAQPMSLDIISSNGEAKAVLEINEGIADKLGMKIGDKVIHSAFK